MIVMKETGTPTYDQRREGFEMANAFLMVDYARSPEIKVHLGALIEFINQNDEGGGVPLDDLIEIFEPTVSINDTQLGTVIDAGRSIGRLEVAGLDARVRITEI